MDALFFDKSSCGGKHIHINRSWSSTQRYICLIVPLGLYTCPTFTQTHSPNYFRTAGSHTIFTGLQWSIAFKKDHQKWVLSSHNPLQAALLETSGDLSSWLPRLIISSIKNWGSLSRAAGLCELLEQGGWVAILQGQNQLPTDLDRELPIL